MKEVKQIIHPEDKLNDSKHSLSDDELEVVAGGRTDHNGVEALYCPVCNVYFYPRDLERHNAVCPNKI